MATDKSTVVTELQTTLSQIQPDIDVNKGPMKRLFIDPHATVIVSERDLIDRLVGLFTLQRVDNILTSEIDAQTSAFSGMGRFQGRKSRGFATFWTRTRPTGSIVINIGDQVSDSTAALIYRVTQQVIVTSVDLVKYWNPVTSRFEILAPIEAMVIGSNYDLPKQRINRILTPISFIDGVINNSEISRGLAIEDNESLDNRFRKRLEGQSLGTKGGLISEIVNIPGVTDVAMVTPADTNLFSRRTERSSAIDLYVLGSDEASDSVSFTVTNSKSFALPAHHITSITSVTLDGDPVTDFAFVPDESVYFGSVKEVDRIELRAQPAPGSVVVVNFLYNSLLETVQDRAAQFGQFSYFDVDCLVYEAVAVPMTVTYDYSFLSSFDKTSVQSALQSETMSYFNPGVFTTVMQPEAFIADLQRKIPSAISIVLRQFTSKEGSTASVQTIQLEKNQYPVLAQSDLNIVLRA